MVWIVMIVSISIASVLQALVPGWAFFSQARFPFLLAVVLYYALSHEMGLALLVALIAGVIHDSLSLIPLGYTVVSFGVAALIVGRFRDLVLAESMITASFFGAVAGGLLSVALYIALTRQGLLDVGLGRMALKAIGSSILGLVTVPAVFLAVGFADRLVGNTEARVD